MSTITNKVYDGSTCPYCGSSEINGEGIEQGVVGGDSPDAVETIECDDCGAEWQDLYKLLGFITLREPTKAGPNAIETIEYSVCEDCILVLANGLSEEAPDEHDRAFGEGVARELGERKGHFCVGIAPTEDDPEGTGYDEFSSHQCELCRSTLAGSRYGATLVFTEDPPVEAS